jgi:hypothetical protein
MLTTIRSRCIVGTLIALAVCATAAPAQASGTKVALWQMNETSGSTMFDTGAAPQNNGTINNVILGVPGINGTFGYGFLSGYVSVPSDPSLNPRRERLRVTIHANVSSLPTSGDFDVIRKGDSPALQYKMEILQSGLLSCGFRGTHRSSFVTSVIPVLPSTGYHRLRCIKTRHYIKAVVDDSVTSLHRRIGSIHSSEPVVIGAHGGGDFDFYIGSLDKAKIRIG